MEIVDDCIDTRAPASVSMSKRANDGCGRRYVVYRGINPNPAPLKITPKITSIVIQAEELGVITQSGGLIGSKKFQFGLIGKLRVSDWDTIVIIWWSGKFLTTKALLIFLSPGAA